MNEPEAESDAIETRKMTSHTPAKKLKFWGSKDGKFGEEGLNPQGRTIPATGRIVTTTFETRNVFHDLPRKTDLNGILGKKIRQREETPSKVDARNASTYLTAA